MSTKPLPLPIKILIIDDDEDDFLLTRRLLGRIDSYQFELDWVKDYDTALLTIAENNHDIYLLDYNLGQADGLVLLDEALESGCRKPIIVLTGQGEQEIDLQAIRRGAADYLVKGEFTPIIFERSIRHAIERTRNLSALQKSEIRYRELFEVLRQSEVRYRGVVEAQVELVCRFQANGLLTFVNPAFCRFINRSRDELIGMSRAELLAPEMQTQFKQHLKALVKEKKAMIHEVQITRDSGELCWIQWTNQIILDSAGNVTEIQSVGRDITTLKQAQAELQGALEKEKELSELKSRFVSMASHEFRTPLATILATTTFLLMAGSDLVPMETELRLLKIKKAVSNMNLLLEDVLTFGKAEAISFEFAPVEMEIVSYCRRLVENIEAVSPTRKINYSSSCSYSMVAVDERLLHHILTNLLSNALKYSPQQETVELELHLSNTRLAIQVSDSGIGIPESDANHLFEPFHRGINVKNIAGTGLGLTIAREAAIAHGGTIEWHSNLNKGTTFDVIIPLENYNAKDSDH